MKEKLNRLLALLLCLCLCLGLAACGSDVIYDLTGDPDPSGDSSGLYYFDIEDDGDVSYDGDTTEYSDTSEDTFDVTTVPAFENESYYIVHNNQPYFTEDEITTEVFETYSELDELGRCGVAYANICPELMPTGKRGDIYWIHPTGWQSVQYDFVDGKSLYNRSHLIAFMLAGESANEQNLITGTRFMNAVGMQYFELMVDEYVVDTGNHVLYRVTPIFEGDNLIASGVLMEGYSVEDEGEGICFCAYVYNCQPGVVIDYATGDNWVDEEEFSDPDSIRDYVLNTRSHKFHSPDCDGINDISESNKADYTGTRDLLVIQGYTPCSTCNP